MTLYCVSVQYKAAALSLKALHIWQNISAVNKASLLLTLIYVFNHDAVCKKKPYIFINKDKSCRREKLKEISLLFYCLLLLFVFTIFYYIFSNSVRLIHTTINKEIHFKNKNKTKCHSFWVILQPPLMFVEAL